MKRSGFMAFGALLLAIFAGVCLWQMPGLAGAKLTKDEVARYVAALEKVPFPPDEKQAVLTHLRTWAEADDGEPFYMLNLMRYHETLRTFPGSLPLSGTPRESNALYEKAAMPLALKTGAYPLFAGEVQGGNVMGFGPGEDGWNRVLLMRYPSRRAFLDLVTDPAYAPIAPYKLMALEVALVPSASELVLPNFWVAVGAVLLLIFVTAGWLRAARRAA
ncbi:MAG TPA: hypothetical protein VEN29_04785 [Casimicrobiaceae bacterium]|nr:hypothetical protein [Casimicrobiaceae bacterium]